MQDVFISYSSKDQCYADFIKRALESNKISCWMAPGSIASGSNYAKEIPNAIRNCRVFVLLLSQAAQMSVWVPKELDLAVNEGKTVIPYMIEECQILDEFNFYLIGAQRLHAYAERADAVRALVERINGVISAAPEQPSREMEVRYAPEPAWKPLGDDVRLSMAEFARMYIARDLIKGHKQFKVRNEEALRQSLLIPEEDEVFLAHDDTLFKSGKNGFAMCTSGIYCRDTADEVSSFFSWDSFAKARDFQLRGALVLSDIYACTEEGDFMIAYVNLLSRPEQELVVRFFKRFSEAMRKACL